MSSGKLEGVLALWSHEAEEDIAIDTVLYGPDNLLPSSTRILALIKALRECREQRDEAWSLTAPPSFDAALAEILQPKETT